MNRLFAGKAWLLAAMVSAAFAAACADEAPSGGKGSADAGNQPITPGADMGGGTPVSGVRRLELVGNRERQVGYSSLTDVSVRLLDGQNQGIASQDVRATLYDAQSNDRTATGVDGSLLRASNARTDAMGVATFQFSAGMLDTTARIRFGSDAVAPMTAPYVDLFVRRAGAGNLVVKAVYVPDGRPNGGRYTFRQINKANVAIFQQDNCDMLRAMATNLRGAYLQLPPIQPFDAVGNTTRVNDLDDGARFSVAVQAATADDRVLAFGCASGVTISGGTDTTIEIPLTDLPLQFKGTFQVIHKFDLTDMLTNSGVEGLDTVNEVLRIIGIIGNANGNRGQEIIRLICEVAMLDETLCDVVEIVGDDIINNLIEMYVPMEILRILEIIGDIYSIVSELTVLGEIQFTAAAPDMNGDLPMTDNRWQFFRFQWRSGCPEPNPDDCVRTFPIGAEGESRPIAGPFTAHLQGITLQIPEHSLNVQYGSILLNIAEDWIIPAILGQPGPISLRDVLADILPCETINDSFPGGANSMFCERILVGALSDLVSAQLGRLNADIDAFTLTGTAEPKDTDGDLQIDRLDNGAWTGTIDFGNMTQVPFRGCFSGCLKVPGTDCPDVDDPCDLVDQ